MIDPESLAAFYPLDGLRADTLAEVAREATVTAHARGEVLFRAGDYDGEMVYLLDGELTAVYPDGRDKTVSSRSLQGRYPIGESYPRRYTATVASDAARVARLDRRFTEKLIAWDQLVRSGAFAALDGEGDANRWVFHLLRSRAFHKLPTGNIERMFQRFEEYPVKAGDVVVREGDAGDYFYVIREGHAAVSRTLDDSEAVIAYLVRGDCFGEDALLAGAPRNATVRMLTDGVLMRLSQKQFTEILKPPVVEWLTPGQASLMAREGAMVVDVRTELEHAQRAIRGALNLPLYRLREQAREQLRPGARVIVYCNTGERSAAAAFILSRQGFDTYAIQGGLAGMIRRLKSDRRGETASA